MQLLQTSLERNFTLKDNNKIYYINYLNSDGQILGLLNRFNWEILDENLEELDVYKFKNMTKNRKEQIKKNIKLLNKLITFCVKHFEDYKPNYKKDI
mgnify:CR=1 FL=1